MNHTDIRNTDSTHTFVDMAKWYNIKTEKLKMCINI